MQKNWCFWTVVLEKTLESPLDCKKIKLVNPKGNQSWIFIERTDAEAEDPINFNHPMERSDSLEKILMLGNIARKKEGDNRGRDGCMASPTQWAWVWASSECWWWTGKPGMLQSRGLQSHRWLRDWTEVNWTALARSNRDQLSGYEEDPWGQVFSAVNLSYSPISWSLWTQEDTPRQSLDIQITPWGK